MRSCTMWAMRIREWSWGRGRLVAGTLTAIVSMTSVSARAEGPPPEAKQAFVDGRAAFERGEYAVALQLFERAALIAPAPSLYYNIGVTEEHLDHFEDGAIAFEKYLQLCDPPQNDQERKFQSDLRERAAADRARGANPAVQHPQPPPQPGPMPAPPPQPPGTRYPPYYYVPVPVGAMPLSHLQRLERDRHHRNNGIALLVVGGVFTLAGAGLVAWTATAPLFGAGPSRGLTIWAATFPLVVGVTLVIPGAVATPRWQHELNVERGRPPDGAAAARAALEMGAPPSLGIPSQVLAMPAPAMFSAPVVRF